MSRAHATTHPADPLHFEVHRSPLVELAADLAVAAAWLFLWLLFLLAVATPTPAICPVPGEEQLAAQPAGDRTLQAHSGADAQPVPGPSGRGVARCTSCGAG
jgi:hypothetical protein